MKAMLTEQIILFSLLHIQIHDTFTNHHFDESQQL